MYEPVWMPCQIAFPDKTGLYMVTVENEEGIRYIAWDFFSIVYGWTFSKVHAWMEMPDIYKHDGYVEFHVKTIDEMLEESE